MTAKHNPKKAVTEEQRLRNEIASSLRQLAIVIESPTGVALKLAELAAGRAPKEVVDGLHDRPNTSRRPPELPVLTPWLTHALASLASGSRRTGYRTTRSRIAGAAAAKLIELGYAKRTRNTGWQVINITKQGRARLRRARGAP